MIRLSLSRLWNLLFPTPSDVYYTFPLILSFHLVARQHKKELPNEERLKVLACVKSGELSQEEAAQIIANMEQELNDNV
jgi:hypothetical protein